MTRRTIVNPRGPELTGPPHIAQYLCENGHGCRKGKTEAKWSLVFVSVEYEISFMFGLAVW